MSFEQILFLNCFAETRRLMFPEIAVTLVGRPAPLAIASFNQCTCLAALADAMTDKQVYIGQSWDIESFWVPIVFRILPDDPEPEQLIYGNPGMIGGSGINAAGLAIADNGISASDLQPGVPYPLVVRKALQQTTLGDLISTIIVAPRTVSINYVIGAPFAAVNLETSATDYVFTYIHDGIFAHANHFDAPELRRLEVGAYWRADTLIREGRMYQLLKEQYGKLNLDTIQDILRDHANSPNSICRHVDSRSGAIETVSGIIYRPSDRLMMVTDGTPCQNPFQSFMIDDHKPHFREAS